MVVQRRRDFPLRGEKIVLYVRVDNSAEFLIAMLCNEIKRATRWLPTELSAKVCCGKKVQLNQIKILKVYCTWNSDKKVSLIVSFVNIMMKQKGERKKKKGSILCSELSPKLSWVKSSEWVSTAGTQMDNKSQNFCTLKNEADGGNSRHGRRLKENEWSLRNINFEQSWVGKFMFGNSIN